MFSKRVALPAWRREGCEALSRRIRIFVNIENLENLEKLENLGNLGNLGNLENLKPDEKLVWEQ